MNDRNYSSIIAIPTQVYAKECMNLKLKFTKNRSHHKKRTAHRYIGACLAQTIQTASNRRPFVQAFGFALF